MSFGAQVFNSSGALIWDSSTVGAGVVADVLVVAAGASGTYEYPDFAGRSVGAVAVAYLGTEVPTTDTALGWPRVTIPSDVSDRTILVVVF